MSVVVLAVTMVMVMGAEDVRMGSGCHGGASRGEVAMRTIVKSSEDLSNPLLHSSSPFSSSSSSSSSSVSSTSSSLPDDDASVSSSPPEPADSLVSSEDGGEEEKAEERASSSDDKTMSFSQSGTEDERARLRPIEPRRVSRQSWSQREESSRRSWGQREGPSRQSRRWLLSQTSPQRARRRSRPGSRLPGRCVLGARGV